MQEKIYITAALLNGIIVDSPSEIKDNKIKDNKIALNILNVSIFQKLIEEYKL